MTDVAAPQTGIKSTKRKIDAAMASLVFAVVVTIGIIALTIALLVQSYREQFTRMETNAASAAHIVAVHTQWLGEASLQVLERIRDRLDGAQFWPDAETYGDINDQLSGLPEYVRITVYGPTGNVRLSNSENLPSASVEDTSFFSRLENGEPVVISRMILGEDQGSAGFIVARRLESNGVFAGVAAITVSNDLLSDVWRSLNLEPGSTISLVRDDGWIVARYPAPAEVISLADYVLFTDYLPQSDTGTYFAPASPVDGIERMVGYRTVDGLDLIAIAAISTDTVTTRYWRNAALALALIVPGLVGLLLALWWLVRILRRDRQTRLELAAAVDQNQVLFREIHHRVKNNLQAVSSLVQLQPVPVAVKQEMGRRIAAMVAVHEHIYRTDQFANAEVSAYLEKLVDDIVAGFDTQASVQTEIARVHVHRDHLMPLGLIVNEALCNAIKYAFPDGRKGVIQVRLTRLADREAELRIVDDGIGFDPAVPSEGMGRRLVMGLAQQVGGVLTYEATERGSAVILTFPIEHDDDASSA